MKQHPYIGKYETTNTETLCLFCKEGFAIDLNDKNFATTDRYCEGVFTNITHEYLSNTWGVVESKEHAEFIIELAEANGFTIYKDSYPIGRDIFSFNKRGTLFFHEDNGLKLSSELKQITIPLPPKEPLKNAGDNLILGCEDSKCDEWIPQVGDEVVAYDIGFEREMTMIYRGKNKNNASIVEFENGNVILLGFEGKIKKPKTPEEELRDDLINCIHNHNEIWRDNNAEIEVSVYEFVGDAILKKYNITKKPQ